MRYLALCSDYDGTLASDGRVLPDTVAALERLRAAGYRLVLVTGRVLPDLHTVCPRLDLFDLVVAENGALLLEPRTGVETLLGSPPSEALLEALHGAEVPASAGRVIVATWTPHEQAVGEVIGALRLPYRIVLNKGAVMILPEGISKGSGVRAALRRLQIPPAAAIAIGDAENDLDLFAACGFAVAVANALPEVKRAADRVMRRDHGAGVAEMIDALLGGELEARDRARADL